MNPDVAKSVAPDEPCIPCIPHVFETLVHPTPPSPRSSTPFGPVAELRPSTAYAICKMHMAFIEHIGKGQSASGHIDDIIGDINTHVKSITNERLPFGELLAHFLLRERVMYFLSSFDTSVLWVFTQNEINSFYWEMKCELEMWMDNMHRLVLQKLEQDKTSRSARKAKQLYEPVCDAFVHMRDECANIDWCKYVDAFSDAGLAITTDRVLFHIPRSHPNIAL